MSTSDPTDDTAPTTNINDIDEDESTPAENKTAGALVEVKEGNDSGRCMMPLLGPYVACSLTDATFSLV